MIPIGSGVMRLQGRDAWQDAPLGAFVTNHAVTSMQSQAPIQTSIVDDTGLLIRDAVSARDVGARSSAGAETRDAS